MIQPKSFLAILAVVLAYKYYTLEFSSFQRESPVVKTLSGSVKGIIGISRDGRKFYEYLGIPYANKPQRFEPPEPVDKWLEILDASTYGSMCLQVDTHYKKIQGSEDCLFLNIFTPKFHEDNVNTSSDLMPVLVFIHGGGFVSGSANMYRPEYFMDFPVILVSMTYRMGSLGFLNTGDEVVRGNMGLKDQTMALRWIQDNIKYFGGDKDRVTIFGESAGAVSVHHHVLSSLSKGLFQKAISESGSSLGTWAFRKNHVEQSKRLGKLIGCPTEDSKSLVKCMKEMDAESIIQGSYSDLLNNLRDPIAIFSPSIEAIKDDKAFLAENPNEILLKGSFNKVPWMSGLNSEDGLIVTGPILRDNKFTELTKNFYVHVPNLMWIPGPTDTPKFERIKKYYFGDEKMDSPDKFKNWTDMFTHSGFGAPNHRSIMQHSQHAPVYAYYYSYKGEFSLMDFILAFSGQYPVEMEYLIHFVPKWLMKITGVQSHHYGSAHLDECGLLFPMKYLSSIGPSDKDYEMSKAMIQTWVAFATNYDSTPLEFNGVTWPPVNPKVDKPIKYMHIDTKAGMIDEPNYEEYIFWNELQL